MSLEQRSKELQLELQLVQMSLEQRWWEMELLSKELQLELPLVNL